MCCAHLFFCCLWKAENWMKEQWYKPGWEPLAGFSLDVATTMAFFGCWEKRRIIRTAFLGGKVIWDLSLMKYVLGRCRCHVFQRNSCLFWFHCWPWQNISGGENNFLNSCVFVSLLNLDKVSLGKNTFVKTICENSPLHSFVSKKKPGRFKSTQLVFWRGSLEGVHFELNVKYIFSPPRTKVPGDDSKPVSVTLISCTDLCSVVPKPRPI